MLQACRSDAAFSLRPSAFIMLAAHHGEPTPVWRRQTRQSRRWHWPNPRGRWRSFRRMRGGVGDKAEQNPFGYTLDNCTGYGVLSAPQKKTQLPRPPPNRGRTCPGCRPNAGGDHGHPPGRRCGEATAQNPASDGAGGGTHAARVVDGDVLGGIGGRRPQCSERAGREGGGGAAGGASRAWRPRVPSPARPGHRSPLGGVGALPTNRAERAGRSS